MNTEYNQVHHEIVIIRDFFQEYILIFYVKVNIPEI